MVQGIYPLPNDVQGLWKSHWFGLPRGKKKCTRIQIGITGTKCSLIGQGVHICERNRLPVLSNYATNILVPGSDHDNKAR